MALIADPKFQKWLLDEQYAAEATENRTRTRRRGGAAAFDDADECGEAGHTVHRISDYQVEVDSPFNR